MNKLTFLIIGSGSIGQRHITNLKKISPKFKTILVRRKTSKSKNFVKPSLIINDYKKFPIEEIDAVILANPSSFREKIIKYFIKNKKPLFIEKPIANTKKQAEKILQILKKNKNVPIMIGYCLRFLKSLIFFKKILSSPELGKIISSQIFFSQDLTSWRRNIRYQDSVSAQKKLGGGVLQEMSHEFDYIQWIFGKIRKRIGHIFLVKSLEMDVHNHADLILKTSNNIVINIHLDMLSNFHQRTCKVLCENGSILWDYNNNFVKWKVNGLKEKKKEFSENQKIEMYISEIKKFLLMIKNKKSEFEYVQDSVDLIKVIEKLKLVKL